MKKVDLVTKVLKSIDDTLVRRVSAVNGEGKAVVREVRSSSLAETLAQARKLVLQAADVTAHADGFGSSTPGNGSPGGGKGGGRLLKIEYRGDDGELLEDLVPTSSTEAAAIASRDMPDPLARLGGRAWRQLNEIAEAVRQLEHTLAAADRLQQTTSVPNVGICAVAAGYELPWDEEWDVREGRGARYTSFEGKLDPPFTQRQQVCSYVYRFVHNHGRLPERSEMLDHLASKAGRR